MCWLWLGLAAWLILALALGPMVGRFLRGTPDG